MKLFTLYESELYNRNIDNEYLSKIRNSLIQAGVPDFDVDQLLKHPIVSSAIADDERNNTPIKYPVDAIYRRWAKQSEIQRNNDIGREIKQNNIVAGLYDKGVIKHKPEPYDGARAEAQRILDAMSDL